MAGFRTHITTSTLLGIAGGAAAFVRYGVPLPTCMLAAGLCSVSGMLPDLDSGPGVPLRESTAFAAAVVPMMLLNQMEQLGWAPETIVLGGGAIYLVIRFGVGWLLRHCTVHRGMFHSLPAAAIAAELTFLICAHEHENIAHRVFNAAAVLVGFMSHLLLDEIWSVDLLHVRIKKSFGTATKMWGEKFVPNVAAYSILIALSFLVLKEPKWMGRHRRANEPPAQMAKVPTTASRM
ncbi:MAG TPA: metal-dependent hydrolase [Pirellulales bacterium]|nr:metal-dependent hydrolase [Pirellulales bacterium]